MYQQLFQMILISTSFYIKYQNSLDTCIIVKLDRTRRQDLFNAMGSMYAAVLFIGVQNAVTVQPVVSVERTVFYRERAAGMYSALPYAFAQVRTFYSAPLILLLKFS